MISPLKKYSTLIFAASSLLLGGCKDNSPSGSGSMEMHFDTRNTQAQDFTLNKAFALPSGDSVKIGSLFYFVSNVQLVKEDGSVFSEPNSYHLMEVSQQNTKEEFQIKNIPAGKYTKVRFLLGVDAAHNQSTANAIGDLTATSHMTWDWNTGYIFLNTSGTFRTQADPAYSGFTFEIGKDPCARQVELDLPAATPSMQIDGKHAPEMHLHMYAANIFSGKNNIDLKSTPMITGEPKYAAESQRVADNFPGMFRIDHIHGE